MPLAERLTAVACWGGKILRLRHKFSVYIFFAKAVHMFYLKYRPRKFSEVIGLPDVTRTIQTILSKKDRPHAFLLMGPRGSGKTTTARLIAKLLNCENPIATESGLDVCDKCSSCIAISEGRYLDLIEIDAASNRGIDDIRQIKERVKLSPSIGRYKVYIIDEVHMLTLEAFNALLKTLEEPPQHAIFILATTEPQKIPETIKSRCHVFSFKRADKASLLSKMGLIVESEGLDILPEKLEEIVRLAEGGYRDAETLLEQIASGFSELATARLQVPSFVSLLVSKQRGEALEFVGEIFKNGVSLPGFTSDVLYYLRDLLLIKSGLKRDDFPTFSDQDWETIFSAAGALSVKELQEMIYYFIKANQDFKVVPIPQLPLEMAIVSILEDKEGERERPKEETKPKTGKDATNSTVDRDIQESTKQEASGLGQEKESGLSVAGENNGNYSNDLTLEAVLGKWDEILKAVKPENHSLEALLRSCRPLEVSNGFLVLEVFYKFHKEKMSSRQSLDILEKVFGKVLSVKTRISCVLGEVRDKKAVETKGSIVSSSPGNNTPEVSDDDVKSAALEAFIGV